MPAASHLTPAQRIPNTARTGVTGQAKRDSGSGAAIWLAGVTAWRLLRRASSTAARTAAMDAPHPFLYRLAYPSAPTATIAAVHAAGELL